MLVDIVSKQGVCPHFPFDLESMLNYIFCIIAKVQSVRLETLIYLSFIGKNNGE